MRNSSFIHAYDVHTHVHASISQGDQAWESAVTYNSNCQSHSIMVSNKLWFDCRLSRGRGLNHWRRGQGSLYKKINNNVHVRMCHIFDYKKKNFCSPFHFELWPFPWRPVRGVHSFPRRSPEPGWWVEPQRTVCPHLFSRQPLLTPY